MGIYYVSGVPYSSDYLMHFGIKGQKWGIRRYQNEDGTLTAEGRQRYGKELGEYANRKQGVFRKLTTGDWALGRKRIGERLENRYERKAKEAREQGRSKEAESYESARKAQRQRNIDREVYQSHASTGKLFAQNFLLGVGADSYRVERKNQTTKGAAAAAGIMANVGDFVGEFTLGIPVGRLTGYATDMYKSKKRYGHITI